MTMTEGKWGPRLTRLTLWAGLGGVVLAGLGAYGSGWGLWHFTTGFLMVGAALLLCLVGLLAGIAALFANRGRQGHGRRTLVGLGAALIFLGIMGYWVNRGASVPMIHDVTTDLANPPAFVKLLMRADNLAGLKGGEAEWRALHAKGYADIAPLQLNRPAAEVSATALALVKQRGWEVALSTPERIEATATDSPFRFKDDVVILIRAEGSATRVDMRSVSRVGLGDLGVNAERVRAFLSELQASKG